MRLNHDCVRSVLLAIEDMDYNTVITTRELKLDNYSIEEIKYVVEKLNDVGFIKGNDCSDFGEYECLIRSLTFEGHAFLDNIRSNEAWGITKTIINKIGSASIEIVASYSAKVTAELIAKQFGI